MVVFLDIVVGGLLLGGIYALVAVGLSLQYGVARVLNIAHGEFIMIGAFTTWWLYTAFGVNPLVTLVITGPASFIIGFLLYRTLFQRLRNTSPTIGAFEGRSMLATFGLLFVIQNVVILVWGADIKGYTYLAFPVELGGAVFGANRLTIFGFTLVIGLAFFLFLARARLGKAIRAAAQDADTARLMGVNIKSALAICFGLGTMMAALAGSLLSIISPLHATIGLKYTIIAIIVVALGGMGSIPGSFLGGFVLGLVGGVVTYFEGGLTLAAYYGLFMVLLLVRPAGILGKKQK